MGQKEFSINSQIILFKFILFCSLFLLEIKSLSQKGELFVDNSPINLTLSYKVKEVNKDRTRETNYHHAILIVNKDSSNTSTYKIQLKPRGVFRLKSSNCFFPPLKLKLNKSEIKETIFSGYKKIKLVLPCQKNKKYEQYLLLEYLAYKIYNLFTNFYFPCLLSSFCKLRLY